MSFIWKLVRLPIQIAFLPFEWVKKRFGGEEDNEKERRCGCFRKRRGKQAYPSARFATKSVWKAPPPATYPKLNRNVEVDVVVVGGGITGLTAALRLVEEKKKVAVIESREIASGTSSYSTANLYVAVEPMYHILKQKFNQSVVNTVIKSRQTAIDFVEKTIKKYSIECGFLRRPMYYFTTSQSKVKMIKDEIATYQDAGITVVETKDLPLNIDFKAAAVLENQARFHPFRYLHAIAARIQELGGLIFENSPVMSIQDKSGIVTISTEKFQITAKKAIIATHSTKGINVYNTLTYPYRSYAIGVKLADKYVNGNFWHLDEPFYTISTHNTNDESELDLMIICGNSHKVGEPNSSCHQQHFEDAKKYAQRYYKVDSIPFQWSAQHYRSADHLPYIGQSPADANVYIGTGFHADGLVYGVVAALTCTDLILGIPNSWASVYNPSRLTVKASSKKFIQENIKVSAEYAKGFLGPAEASTVEEVKQGEGKLVRKGLSKLAVHRDDNGKLHVLTAVCPHLYGIVKWNDAEKTWDCPCHGSRFGIDGEVLEGPAMHALKRYEW